MKKISLLVCLMAMTSAIFAAPISKKRPEAHAVAQQNVHFVERNDVNFTDAPVSLFKSKAALDETYDGKYIVYNTAEWHSGIPESGIRYVNEASIIVPYVEEVEYRSMYKGECSWLVEGLEVAKGGSYLQKTNGFETLPLPLLKTPDYVISADSVIHFNDYQFGAYYTSKYAQYGFENKLEVAPYYTNTPMTKCAMYTEVQTDSRGDDTYGTDWTFVGAGKLGTYSYGSHLTNPFTPTEEIDTIFCFIENDGPIYIEHVSLGVFTANDAVLGNGDAITLTLYPVDETGAIDHENPFAQAVATIDNYIGAQDQTSWYGLLDFVFYEEDEFGGEVEVAILHDGNFIAELTGFNDGTADLGFITDYYTEVDGNTYFRLESDGQRVITQLWQSPSSLLMNFYGKLPAVINDVVEIEAGLKGGEYSFSLYTNCFGDDLYAEEELPEGFDIEVVEQKTHTDGQYTYYDNELVLSVYVPAAEEAREVEINLLALGKPFTIKVSQDGEKPGPEPEGFSNTAATVKAEKMVKNGQFIIRKGDKTFNAVGQEIK